MRCPTDSTKGTQAYAVQITSSECLCHCKKIPSAQFDLVTCLSLGCYFHQDKPDHYGPLSSLAQFFDKKQHCVPLC